MDEFEKVVLEWQADVLVRLVEICDLLQWQKAMWEKQMKENQNGH